MRFGGASEEVRSGIPESLRRAICGRALPLALGLMCFCWMQSLPAFSADNAAKPLDADTDSGLYLKIQLDDPVKTSKLRPGDVVQGKLALDVYSGERELFPSGSAVRLTVDKLGRRKRTPNDHWPWVIKAFTPRHENYPIFTSATVACPEGGEVALHASLIAISQKVEVHAPAKKPPADAATNQAGTQKQTSSKSANAKTQAAKIIVTLEAERPGPELAAAASETSAPVAAKPRELAAGTLAKVVLLAPVSASKNFPGDTFLARLVEPVHVEGAMVLPEGSLFEGRVLRRTPPRMLSRPGSVLFSFTQLKVPGAEGVPIAASLSAAELDQRSHTRIDPEGRMRGERPGKAWMLINIGTTAGIAKVADDGTQLIIEAIVSTATDASTAGTARIVATCASVLFLLTRHGRDVVLPRFTEMNVVFDRPVAMAPLHPELIAP